MKRWLPLLVAASAFLACNKKSSSSQETVAPIKPLIGFSLADLKEERWQRDRDFFTAKAESLGAFSLASFTFTALRPFFPSAGFAAASGEDCVDASPPESAGFKILPLAAPPPPGDRPAGSALACRCPWNTWERARRG